jgi:hypothetical protein
MLKASALYIVIIISLVIGLLCSSLIVVAYFYRLQYHRTFRSDQLHNNLNSAINILTVNSDSTFNEGKTLSLFGGEADSVFLKKIPWGMFDVGVARSFIQRDSLYKTFLLANMIDSSKWAALYLIDEDRPLSVSGKASIVGDVYIAKAGIKEAYVDGRSYQGDKRLVIGKKNNSNKELPLLNTDRLRLIEKYFNYSGSSNTALLKQDSLYNSFLLDTYTIKFGNKVSSIENIKLSGNIIIYSDTTLTIESTAQLNNCVVFAHAIVVKKGFKGTCQLFATDSVSIERDCVFSYPSSISVTRFESSKVSAPILLNISENTSIAGMVFSYDKYFDRNKQPLIDLGKNVHISGQLYSQGMLGLKDGVNIAGSVFTNRFIYQSSFTRYENYLINTTINSTALSSYYLNSDLMPVSSKKKKILQWLESN